MNTVLDLISLARIELGDPEINGSDTYSFYKDSELIEWANNAQQEFSRFTRCLPDYDSLSLALTAGEGAYTLDEVVLDIFGGKLAESGTRVKVDSFANIERRYMLDQVDIATWGDWESEVGVPKYMIPDMEIGKVVLYPTPSASGTLNLYVYKLSNIVNSAEDVLEIPNQHRYGLLFRIVSLAFNKVDTTNIQDSEKSMLFSQKWASFLQDAKEFYDTRFKRSGVK